MIGSWARSVRFDEERPAKNWSELVSRKNEEYQIADKASSAYASATAGLVSLWSSMTAPAEGEQNAAAAGQPDPAAQ